jgi:DNA-binding transcriptional ArsR family regulator
LKSKFFKALGHPVRIRILEILVGRAECAFISPGGSVDQIILVDVFVDVFVDGMDV